MAARRVKSKEPPGPSTLEIAFRRYWAICGLKIEPRDQFPFDMGRRWRFDFAWPTYRVAVELHGGEHTGGRHTTGVGLMADCEKMRAALLRGWLVMPITGAELRQAPVQRIEEIKQLLQMRGAS